MKKIITLFITCLIAVVSFSQDIEVDKNTGLVKVDGRDSFYLIKKNKGIMGWADLSFQNLNKEELAYFTDKKTEDLPYNERGSHVGTFYKVTFTETGNTANIFPDAFSGIKAIAKKIINAGLIKDNQVNAKAERSFIISNDGKIFREPNDKPITVVVKTEPAVNPAVQKAPADILIKENKIYNNSELAGSFKKLTDANNITTISVYNKDDSKIATATHNNADANADWNLSTMADGKTTQLLYNNSTPLEKLFKYLAEKGFF